MANAINAPGTLDTTDTMRPATSSNVIIESSTVCTFKSTSTIRAVTTVRLTSDAMDAIRILTPTDDA